MNQSYSFPILHGTKQALKACVFGFALLVSVLLYPTASEAAGVSVSAEKEVITTSTNWVVPANVTSATFTIVGGGGGAGGYSGQGSFLKYGNTGSSGNVLKVTLPVTPGATFPIVVGKGGGLGYPGDAGNGTCGSDGYFYYVAQNNAVNAALGGTGYANGGKGMAGAACSWSYTPSQAQGGGGGGSTALTTATTTYVAAGGNGGVGAAGTNFVAQNGGLGGTGFGAVNTTLANGLGLGGVNAQGIIGGVIVDYLVVTGTPTSTPDVTPPTLVLVGATTTTVVVGSTYVDLGAVAVDNIDGDITSRIVATSTVNTAVFGTYTVTYRVSDTALNAATPVVRTVVVVPAVTVDITPPVLSLIGPSMVTATTGSSYVDQGATAFDAVDGNITSSIVATSTVNMTVPGIYFVTYNVKDAAGNNAAPLVRIVEVKSSDITAPLISLVGSSTVSLSLGSSYVDQGAIALDNVDGDITSRIVASSTVNTAIAGTYTVSYIVSDAAHNTAFITRLVTVTAPSVSDAVAPLLHIIGSTTATLLVGTSYTDLGAYAVDAVDGDVTSQIIATSTVDTTIPGTYSVSYSVSDAAGNTASSSRIVIVLVTPDITAPTAPTLVSSSHAVGVATTSTNVTMVWSDSTDTASGILGYALSFDNNASGTPGTSVDTTSTSTATVLTNGTWYFHVRAFDGAGNASSVTTYGPIIISNSSAVSISNSTIGGTFYALLIPTLASSTDFNLFGTTTIASSNIGGVSVLDTTSVLVSSFTNSSSTRSTIVSSTIASSTLIDASVSNVTLVNSVIDGSHATSTTITGSTVEAGSTIVGGSVASSTLTSVDALNTVISSSTVSDTTLTNATVTNGVVQNSTLTNIVVTGASSTIINSTLDGTALGTTTLTNVTIIDNVVTGGTITPPNGTPIVIVTPTPVASFVNVAPLPSITLSTSTALTATFVGFAHDANETSSIPDSWSYYWDFGDSVTGATLNSTTTNTQVHTFSVAGTYLVNLDVFDQYGLGNSTSTLITVSLASTTPGTTTPPTIFTLTASSTGPGVVTPTLATTTAGSDITFTITPDASSTISSLFVDGTSTATTTSFVFTNVQSDHSLFATFAPIVVASSTPGTTTPPTIFSVTASSTGPGSITPTSATTTSGGDLTFAITPTDASSTISSLLIDGSAVATTTSLTLTNVISDHTIFATFDVITPATSTPGTTTPPVFFTLTASSTGPGSITPSASSTLAGSDVTFAITPDASSTISQLLIDGSSLATTTSFTFTNVQANHLIEAIFAPVAAATSTPGTTTPPTIFTVTASSTGPGFITPNSATTTSGGDLTFAITPTDASSTIASLLIDGSAVATTSSLTLTNITTDHTIFATFDVITPATSTPGTTTPPTIFTLTASSTGPGVVTPTIATTTAGSDVTFTITPDASSTIATLLVDGTSTATTTSFVFTNVQSDHSLFATFAPIVVATSTPGTTTPPIVDTSAPTAPSFVGVTTTATTTLTSTVQVSWDPSLDDVAVSGYSFLWDTNASTTPDSITEIVGTSTTTVLPNGTWYFHIVGVDTSGNVSTTTSFGPLVVNNLPQTDTEPPFGPTLVTSTTHAVGTTTDITTVSVSWDAATDNVGVAGYSYLWDNNPTSTPDAVAESASTNYTTNLTNGTWYFHVVAVDTTGNISTSTISYGPITIAATFTDVTPPVGPILVTSGTHTVAATSTNHTVTVDWDFANDDVALAGYSYLWDHAATTTPDDVVEGNSIPYTTTLTDGTWYFHIKSLDTSGNSSIPVDFGPIGITTFILGDTVPPSAPVVSVTKVGTTTLSAEWSDATDNVGVAGYSFLWDTNASTTPDTIIETSATTTSSLFTDGVWYFHLLSVDSALNTSSVVTGGPLTIDTTAPTLSLVGSSTVVLVAGTSTSYTDSGATAFDALEGNLTSSVVTTGVVDTLVPGTYTLTYHVSDAAGNSALPITRSIHVLASPDVVAPTITILGANPTNIFVGTSYTDSGATAVDAVDGNVTASIVASSSVNTNLVGAYEVVYSVSDASQNVASSTRTVNVVPLSLFTIVASTTGTGFGSITPLGTTTATSTTSVTYTITPNLGNFLSVLLVDGQATTTSGTYTFSNIQSDHSITAVFAVSPAAPTFTLFASSTPNGVIAPVGTTTLSQGANQVVSITPDAGFTIASLVVDGVSVATATPVAFTNINGDHTVEVYFDVAPTDTTAPTAVGVTSDHATTTPSVVTNTTWFWSQSTDASSGLAGYSFVFDASPTTTPDTIVDTTQNFVNTILGPGTVYFHIVAVDNAGNASAVTHFGPVTISDSAILITNSTLGGVYYDVFSPTLASAPALFLSGTTTIASSTVTGPWNLSTVQLASTTVASSTLSNVSATLSTILNANLTNCTIVNSLVKNYVAFNCSISDSIVDPVGTLNDLTGSSVSGGSQIYVSDVLYSVVVNSYIATSTVTYSTLTNATVLSSTIATSTLSNTSVTNSGVTTSSALGSTLTDASLLGSTVATSTVSAALITNSSITNTSFAQGTSTNSNVVGSTLSGSDVVNADIASSTLSNVSILGASSTISNSHLSNMTLTDAVVANDTMTSGTITVGTTTITVATPLYIPSLFNVAPIASFSVGHSNLTVNTTDTSTDLNLGTSVPDAWVYSWDFGDGVAVSASSTTIGTNNQTHTFGATGTYTITLTITDAYGAIASSSVQVAVSAPVVAPVSSGGGGGGGGGGNGPIDPLYFYYPRSTNVSAASTTIASSTNSNVVTPDNRELIARLEKQLLALKAELAELTLALAKPVTSPRHVAIAKPVKVASSSPVLLTPRKDTSGIVTIGKDTSGLANVSSAKNISWFDKVKTFVKKLLTPKTATDN